eukprot:CAMPEP_0174327992 /NCGR_PEP_ID=MMETSP0810-20121108/14841_1 /TAXON_ID=73025 ORGANISM="Eutreptiella gymnastica-like, Strain CCMP1594" /NCGR_SAMPLE_ID=MMETSP0810 /ASSEMBLY_ACC=CAM_ASM_000659 /LENGTH=118 /DNA_ID=CAMNT_0015441933 /DNA_START=1520 /DNA_END=1873 /DNA_ORIENTATION=+
MASVLTSAASIDVSAFGTLCGLATLERRPSPMLGRGFRVANIVAETACKAPPLGASPIVAKRSRPTALWGRHASESKRAASCLGNERGRSLETSLKDVQASSNSAAAFEPTGRIEIEK